MALLYVAVGLGIGLMFGIILGEILERSESKKQQKREMQALQDGFRTAFEHWSEHDRDSETVDEMWQKTIEAKNAIGSASAESIAAETQVDDENE